jgi:phosphate transporter
MIIGRSGSDPKWVILTNMLVSTFFSMWISNVAAPVLCFSLVSPILRNLPQKSPYGISLVLGIAMAANVGGMASPIASPQNIIAVGQMSPSPSWGEWFIIALPVCLILDLLIWGLLIAVYNPSITGQQAAPPEIFSNQHIANHKFNETQIFILFVSVFTILLWCTESVMKDVVGDMGVIAIIPIVCFYGTGVLTKDDWNSMLWSGIWH